MLIEGGFCQLSTQISNITSDVNLDDFSDRCLLIFELSVGGHYPTYILHLIRYWQKHQCLGVLKLVVSPRFLQDHAEVVQAAKSSANNIQFIAITPAQELALQPRTSSWRRKIREFQEWELLRQYATQLQADHCLLLYFDNRQLPLAVRSRLPCACSGIYFRPTFHYRQFGREAGQSAAPSSWQQHLREEWEKFYLSRALHHAQMRYLFCLDPFVVEPVTQLKTPTQAVFLPDPIETYDVVPEQLSRFRADLGVEPGRRVFLLFGGLSARKGIHPLLEAVLQLSTEDCQQFCLLLVGTIATPDQPLVQSQLQRIATTQPAQVIVRDQYIPDADVQLYFQSSDVALATYQRHVGMSGILVWAAATQKPVLSSDYGLMGEITRRYQLGLTVDSTDATAIAAGLQQLLHQPLEKIGDRAQMQVFAKQNEAEAFSRVIFEHISNNQANR
jgi:glycosyltransferase involved in cell wall biosynthesis